MGIRLEYILPIIIVGLVAMFSLVDINTQKKDRQAAGKELEFTKTTFIEVDTNKTLGIAFAESGFYEKRVWTLYELRYHTDSINLLQSQEGRSKGDTLFLDGNVKLNQKAGFDYEAEHAVYHKKSEVLHITSPFVAYMNDNIIKGENLIYKTKEKTATGDRIDAEVYTKEK